MLQLNGMLEMAGGQIDGSTPDVLPEVQDEILEINERVEQLEVIGPPLLTRATVHGLHVLVRGLRSVAD